MDEAPPLAIEGVTFRYRDRHTPAITDISFTASAGEILLIAGASGCGKTTLIRAINGLVPRSYKGEIKGNLRIFGEDPSSWKLSRISQSVGTVLQDPERQILGTKVLNEVAFGLENLGLPRPEIRSRAQEALAILGIADLQDRDTFNLSGGEKQKVALAGVLAMRPRILLLDEPLASLDSASARESLDMIRILADEGLTVLLVEHRVEDVLRIRPDHVMYLSDGKVRYFGAASGLSDVVDFHEVKLPAPEIVRLAAMEPPGVESIPGRRIGSRTAPGETLVRFEDVAFGYDDSPNVLEGVTLDIHAGDIVAVLGANGAGKTTLVKHAIGLLKPRTGRVLVGHHDTRTSSVAEIAQTIGYVFQSPSHMLFAPTVREELAFGPTNLKHPKDQIQKEVKAALKTVNLSDREEDPPLALSFGQQKRVSIAAILSMRSKILVMDEPTAGQDYQNYIRFMDSILGLPDFEALLFITHDVDLAVIYANRVLLVSDGRVVADGAPEVVLRDLDRLEACRVVPSSLLMLNLEGPSAGRRFMRAEEIAHS
jgi:energy-coupling factor transporter ATP-binding protein EcfA2